jgi:hypothetical protein
MPGTPPIIIKRKVSHGGHHGGAWKVAYADFVTAVMALFIVLWLMNSSKQIQEAVGGYFKDPTGTAKQVGSDMVGAGENFIVTKDNMEQLKEQLQKAIREVPKFDKLKNHVDMTVTNEGLRIELTESAAGTFFDSGSPKISADGSDLLKTLAEELGKLPNKLALEGHTDSKPYADCASHRIRLTRRTGESLSLCSISRSAPSCRCPSLTNPRKPNRPVPKLNLNATIQSRLNPSLLSPNLRIIRPTEQFVHPLATPSVAAKDGSRARTL